MGVWSDESSGAAIPRGDSEADRLRSSSVRPIAIFRFALPGRHQRGTSPESTNLVGQLGTCVRKTRERVGPLVAHFVFRPQRCRFIASMGWSKSSLHSLNESAFNFVASKHEHGVGCEQTK